MHHCAYLDAETKLSSVSISFMFSDTTLPEDPQLQAAGQTVLSSGQRQFGSSFVSAWHKVLHRLM